MSDRTSAGIFSEIIALLDSPNSMTRKQLIKKVYKAIEGYDFHPCQMEIDDILKKHGLMKEVKSKYYPDEIEPLYKGVDF